MIPIDLRSLVPDKGKRDAKNGPRCAPHSCLERVSEKRVEFIAIDVVPLTSPSPRRWALGVPRIDGGESPPARRTCPVEEGSPEPRNCCAAEVGWGAGPAGPGSHAL